jgi:hypothetical protein
MHVIILFNKNNGPRNLVKIVILFLFRRLDPIMRAGFEGKDTQKNEPHLKCIVQQYLSPKYS